MKRKLGILALAVLISLLAIHCLLSISGSDQKGGEEDCGWQIAPACRRQGLKKSEI
jgi:hypothetical protein